MTIENILQAITYILCGGIAYAAILWPIAIILNFYSNAYSYIIVMYGEKREEYFHARALYCVVLLVLFTICITIYYHILFYSLVNIITNLLLMFKVKFDNGEYRSLYRR